MVNKRDQFLKWINETFKPELPQYPAAFKSNDGEYLVTSEVSVIYPDDGVAIPLVDYYGEFRGGYPWINPEVEAKAKEMGLYLEWRDPGSVSVHE